MLFPITHFTKSRTLSRSQCWSRQRSRTPLTPKPLPSPPGITRVLVSRAAVDAPPGPTEVASLEHRELLHSEINRRILLARGASLCAITSLTGLHFAARPCTAALVDEDVATTVFQAVSPSVACIAIVRSVGGAQLREVLGSGIVWDAVGPHVLTNFHIVPPLQGNVLLEVTVQDAVTGTFATLPARVSGSDSLHDIAVLKLLPPLPSQPPQQQQPGGGSETVAEGSAESPGDGSDGPLQAALPTLAAIRVAALGELRVGQFVYALGCVASDPAAPTRSLSAGLVSGLGRSIPSPVGARIYGVVQTEAVINEDNSGGPLVDSLGRLVGLSTAVGAARANSARGSGVSFALPLELLLDLVPKIIVYGNPYGKK